MMPIIRTTNQIVFKHVNYISLLMDMVDYFNTHPKSPDTELMEDTTIVFDNASQSYIATVYCLWRLE